MSVKKRCLPVAPRRTFCQIPIFGLDALARAGCGPSQAADTTGLNVSIGTEVIGKKSNVAAQNHRGASMFGQAIGALPIMTLLDTASSTFGPRSEPLIQWDMGIVTAVRGCL